MSVGGRADLKGEDGATYNLVSARNFSLAALFQHTTFKMNENKLVHGSFMYSVRLPLSPLGRIIFRLHVPSTIARRHTSVCAQC